MKQNTNIFPQFDKSLSRKAKEDFLQQRALCFWFTGLSGSGKSTYAIALEAYLQEQNVLSKLLDGDNVRSGLCANLSFSDSDRNENIRRIAEVSKLFMDNGTVCINSFVSPTHKSRSIAQEIIGSGFYEIYVHATFDTCAQRDVKGLYAKALAGEIKNFTGLDTPYEIPKSPFLTLDTEKYSFQENFNQLTHTILPLVKPSIL